MTLTLILTWLASLAAVALVIPIGFLAIEVAVACIIRKQNCRPLVQQPPKTAVLIPAHNEELVIGEMLTALRDRLRGNERILLVADNCTDRTAAIARSRGVEVLERHDAQLRGKGFALAHGIKHLEQNPPEVLVILDADCEISEDAVARLASEAQLAGRPVQGLYLCYAPSFDEPKTALSALAFQFKNQIRPLGMNALGGPSYLTGSGMAIPWKLVQAVPWATGNVVEDMQLGLDYAVAGYCPLYYDGAQIRSPLPTDASAANKQRTRWEHGQLSTLLSQCPRLVISAVRDVRFSLLLLALDLAIPPLALLTMLWGVGFATTLIAAIFTGIVWPLELTFGLGVVLTTTILAGWACFSSREIPFRTLLAIPGYVASKFAIYRRFLGKPQQEWVRTEREASASATSESEKTRTGAASGR